MANEIIIFGKAIMRLPDQTGVSKKTGNPWRKATYVLETIEQYPRKIAFEVFGDDAINSFNVHSNDFIKVYLNISASEYNGKYYNHVSAWKVEHTDCNGNILNNGAPATPAPAPQQAAAPAPTTSYDNVPF